MDFYTLIIIAVVLSVLGFIGTILFWGGIAFLGFKAVQSYQKELDAMMNSYTANLSNLQNQYGNQIPPDIQMQVFTQFTQAQNQMSHFDNLSCQRQDLIRSDMLSQASSVGIDVSSWNY